VNLQVVLADDHAMFREAVKALLGHATIDVTGEAANGREAVQLACELRPAIAVLDLNMPIMNELDAAREIVKMAFKTQVVLLTMFGEERFVLEALRAGVRGYVLKAQAFSDLVNAIRQIARGTIYLSPAISEVVVNALTRPDSVDPLTEREQQVLRLIAEGRTAKDIGSALGLSEKTAISHRNRIMRKLDIHATADLVRYAVRRGLVEI
jgi:two-component system, NarL family, response regulator NreC